MTSTGTFSFAPPASDLVLEAYSRCGIRAGALNAQHLFDARMSTQLLLSSWSVRVPNLWLVELINIPLTQGVFIYSLPSNVVTTLDGYVRKFQTGNPVNAPVSVSTVSGSSTVKITWPGSNVYANQWIGINAPISVGGVILQGFYQVASVIDFNNFNVSLANSATSTVNNGGAVPQFVAVAGSSSITVNFANHGLAVGQNFTVGVSTIVGGTVLNGTYPVSAVNSLNQFVITNTTQAFTNDTESENGGLANYSSQLLNSQPIDRVITPFSRTDYSAQPNKFTQGFPTNYWFNRQINPVVNLWMVPDQNGPYTLALYCVTQLQDGSITGGSTLDIPYRFLDAFAAGLARRLGRKYAPALVAELAIEEKEAWDMSAQQDTEDVPMFITPGMTGYFR